MPGRRSAQKAIPEQFSSLDEAADFWASHDLADFWAETREADFDVDLKRERFQIGLDPELAARLIVEARRRGVSPETLVNLWVSTKLVESVA